MPLPKATTTTRRFGIDRYKSIIYMRDKKRIPKILKEIEKIWITQPDLRLGQLLGNYLEGLGLYCIEDEQLVEVLKKGYKE